MLSWWQLLFGAAFLLWLWRFSKRKMADMEIYRAGAAAAAESEQMQKNPRQFTKDECAPPARPPPPDGYTLRRARAGCSPTTVPIRASRCCFP